MRNILFALPVFAAALVLGVHASQSAATLTGQSAINALIGNSYFYTDDGKSRVTYFAKDGKFSDLEISTTRNDDIVHGVWKVKGDKFCTENTDGPPEPNCATISINGNDVTFEADVPNQKGVVEHLTQKGKLVSGNPKNL